MIAPMATTAPPVKRKLAAILAADAVGYSRHMARDEEETMRILSAHRAVIDGIIDFHSGRIVGTAGDSVLAEFASPVEALRCAVEIQAALKTRNESLPEEKRLAFHIGINLGDVMVKGDDLLGDGVNVAARLEGIAEPGGICISSSVYDQIAGKLDLGFVEMGEKSLKNIDRPIRVYSVQPGVQGVKRARGARRRMPYALAAVLLAGVAVAAGWWRFDGPGAEPASRSAPLPVPAPRLEPAAARSGIDAAQQREAAAREEEERKLAAERGDTERRAEEARIAAVRAKAEEEVAKARAQAELEKARADAEALRREAQAEVAEARKSAAATGPTARTQVALAAPAAASEPPKPTVAAADPQRDKAAAAWIATLHCDAFRGSQELFGEVPVRFLDGEFVVERRPEGIGGHFVLRGRPASDGRLQLTGSVVAPRGRMRGEELPVQLDGTLEQGRYVTRGTLGARPCEIDIARR